MPSHPAASTWSCCKPRRSMTTSRGGQRRPEALCEQVDAVRRASPPVRLRDIFAAAHQARRLPEQRRRARGNTTATRQATARRVRRPEAASRGNVGRRGRASRRPRGSRWRSARSVASGREMNRPRSNVRPPVMTIDGDTASTRRAGHKRAQPPRLLDCRVRPPSVSRRREYTAMKNARRRRSSRPCRPSRRGRCRRRAPTGDPGPRGAAPREQRQQERGDNRNGRAGARRHRREAEETPARTERGGNGDSSAGGTCHGQTSHASAYIVAMFANTYASSSTFCAAIDRQRLQQRGRHERRQRGMRMVGDGGAERIEQVGGVKILEPRRRQPVPHPPQVPQEAVVVAGFRAPRRADGRRAATSTRPPAREQRQRTECFIYLRGMTTSTPRICRQPSSTCRLQ